MAEGVSSRSRRSSDWQPFAGVVEHDDVDVEEDSGDVEEECGDVEVDRVEEEQVKILAGHYVEQSMVPVAVSDGLVISAAPCVKVDPVVDHTVGFLVLNEAPLDIEPPSSVDVVALEPILACLHPDDWDDEFKLFKVSDGGSRFFAHQARSASLGDYE